MKLKNSALQELYDTILGGGTVTFTVDEESPIDKAFKECDEKLSESITFATIKDLQDRNDILEGSNKALLEANMELASKKRQLEKDLDDAKKNVEYFRDCRDDWRSRAKRAEKEVEDLASQYQKLTIENKRLQDANTTLEKASADRTNLQEAFDKLSGENRWLNARIDCLRLEVNWYRKHYKEQSDKILGLKSRLNSMCGDEYIKKLQDSVRDIGYKQGQKDLWDMLQEVSDYYYFGGDDEFDTDDCEMTSMTDIIDNLNVDQFLEAYKNWHKSQEQHRLDRMRDWLYDFCRNRFCTGCPLRSIEYQCGRGYSFKGANPVPDEDIERYYEKARKTWTCTLEGTVEIDKDLLNKVFGIDSDD